MPCDYKNYPSNWRSEIWPRILERDGHACKVCRVPNYTIGYRAKDGKFYSYELIEAALEERGYDYFDHELKEVGYDKKGNPTKPIKIVLTVAHLDRDTTNNDDRNLAAMCQYHHLKHDHNFHQANARETRNKKKKLQTLF